MMATLLLLLKARWALMKTRILAMAAERVRVGARRAQAWGFVSRIMVKREGGGSEESVSVLTWLRRLWMFATCRQRSCCSGLNRRLRSWWQY